MDESPFKQSNVKTTSMNDEWWRGAAIYQIYPRSFYDSNGDGIGDLQGILDKAEYIASLGVDGIWLSPFFVSPMTDFGYDVSDYRNVDPLFGSLADFDKLVFRAHELGLKVLIDMVWAHTSNLHSWFADSRASRIGPRSDWYVWADARADGTPPNNWLSVFGGDAWTWEPRRQQYYLHHFLPSQPKLNLRNPAVMEALLEVARLWLDRGIDGFRLDAVDFLVHDEALRDNPLAETGRAVTKPYHMQQHLHDLGGTDALPVIERIRTLTDRYPDAVLIAEVGSETTDTTSLTRAGGYVGDGQQGVHTAYSLSQMKSPGDAATIRSAILDVERLFPDGDFVWAFSNHDVARVVTRWADGSTAAAKLFMALSLSLRGGVFIYQGEELGLPEAEVPFELRRDPYGRNHWPDFKGRDGSRTPMPWLRRGKNAGFSQAKTTWLPIPDAHRELAVDVQEKDPNSVLNEWRRFLRWRKEHLALRCGALALREAPDPLVIFERRCNDESLLCVFNVSGKPVDFVPFDNRLTPVGGFGWSNTGSAIRLKGYGVYIAREG